MKKLLFSLFAVSLMLSLQSCGTPRMARSAGTIGPDTSVITTNTLYVYGGLRQNVYHSVAPGETLWRISKMYGVGIDTIKKVNKIKNERDIKIGKKLLIPEALPRKDVITMYPSRKWKYIIVHHSATDKGDSAEFNRAHIKRGWNGIGYDFVIDNGTYGKDDGQIEVSPRWIQQENGAHCKASHMNTKAIGICVVGNFSVGSPTEKQMDSLVFLVNTLRKYYRIPLNHIMGHGQVPGAKTECPGTKFPWKTFWRKLKK